MVRIVRILLVVTLSVALLAAAIVLVSVNRVSFNATALPNAWEPSSAAGPTWVTSWAAINNAVTSAQSFISAWNGVGWITPLGLTPPNGRAVGDVYMESIASKLAL